MQYFFNKKILWNFSEARHFEFWFIFGYKPVTKWFKDLKLKKWYQSTYYTDIISSLSIQNWNYEFPKKLLEVIVVRLYN